MAQGGVLLAVAAVRRQVAADRVVEMQLALFGQMMHQHGGDRFRGGKQAHRGLGGEQALAHRVGVADCPVQEHAAPAAQAQRDARAHAAPVEPPRGPPDRLDPVVVEPGLGGGRFAAPGGDRRQIAGDRGALRGKKAAEAGA